MSPHTPPACVTRWRCAAAGGRGSEVGGGRPFQPVEQFPSSGPTPCRNTEAKPAACRCRRAPARQPPPPPPDQRATCMLSLALSLAACRPTAAVGRWQTLAKTKCGGRCRFGGEAEAERHLADGGEIGERVRRIQRIDRLPREVDQQRHRRAHHPPRRGRIGKVQVILPSLLQQRPLVSVS